MGSESGTVGRGKEGGKVRKAEGPAYPLSPSPLPAHPSSSLTENPQLHDVRIHLGTYLLWRASAPATECSQMIPEMGGRHSPCWGHLASQSSARLEFPEGVWQAQLDPGTPACQCPWLVPALLCGGPREAGSLLSGTAGVQSRAPSAARNHMALFSVLCSHPSSLHASKARTSQGLLGDVPTCCDCS